MKKIILLSVFGASAAMSQAAVNLTIDNPYQGVDLPSSGQVVLTFTGTVDIQLPDYDLFSIALDFPGLTTGGPFLSSAIDSNFSSYMGASNPGVDYTGALFSVTVDASDAPGDYFFNSANNTNLADLLIMASDGVHTSTDSEAFGVSVRAVPEPASMAVLGLGVAALLRKRRK